MGANPWKKEGGERERRQVEGKRERESDDITPCDTMTLIKGVHTDVHGGEDKSPRVCSAAGTNLNTVYMPRRGRE